MDTNKTIDFTDSIIKLFVEGLRPNEEIRNQLDIGYSFEKNTAEIYEIRPDWQDNSIKNTFPFAKFKYIKSKKVWKLYWMRASGKWELLI